MLRKLRLRQKNGFLIKKRVDDKKIFNCSINIYYKKYFLLCLIKLCSQNIFCQLKKGLRQGLFV